jgi:hypothetical protein
MTYPQVIHATAPRHRTVLRCGRGRVIFQWRFFPSSSSSYYYYYYYYYYSETTLINPLKRGYVQESSLASGYSEKDLTPARGVCHSPSENYSPSGLAQKRYIYIGGLPVEA